MSLVDGCRQDRRHLLPLLGIDNLTGVLSPLKGKVTPVIDNFETTMRRGGHDTGYIVGFSFTRGAREDVARARVQDGLDI